MRFMGVDPGAQGGIGVVGGKGPQVWAFPTDERDIWDLFENEIGDVSFAYLEEVHAIFGASAKSTFSFGRNYGLVRGFLIARRIPFLEVPPKLWQASFGLRRGRTGRKQEDSKAYKRRILAKAKQMFPHLALDLATADALLIAEYCRLVRTRREE